MVFDNNPNNDTTNDTSWMTIGETVKIQWKKKWRAATIKESPQLLVDEWTVLVAWKDSNRVQTVQCKGCRRLLLLSNNDNHDDDNHDDNHVTINHINHKHKFTLLSPSIKNNGILLKSIKCSLMGSCSLEVNTTTQDDHDHHDHDHECAPVFKASSTRQFTNATAATAATTATTTATTATTNQSAETTQLKDLPPLPPPQTLTRNAASRRSPTKRRSSSSSSSSSSGLQKPSECHILDPTGRAVPLPLLTTSPPRPASSYVEDFQFISPHLTLLYALANSKKNRNDRALDQAAVAIGKPHHHQRTNANANADANASSSVIDLTADDDDDDDHDDDGSNDEEVDFTKEDASSCSANTNGRSSAMEDDNPNNDSNHDDDDRATGRKRKHLFVRQTDSSPTRNQSQLKHNENSTRGNDNDHGAHKSDDAHDDDEPSTTNDPLSNVRREFAELRQFWQASSTAEASPLLEQTTEITTTTTTMVEMHTSRQAKSPTNSPPNSPAMRRSGRNKLTSAERDLALRRRFFTTFHVSSGTDQCDPEGVGCISRRAIEIGEEFIDPYATYQHGAPPGKVACTRGSYIKTKEGYFALVPSATEWINAPSHGRKANVNFRARYDSICGDGCSPTGTTKMLLVWKVVQPINNGDEVLAEYGGADFDGFVNANV